MSQCKRLKQSAGSGQFCCNKIAAGITVLGWPLPIFCERLADGTQLEVDLRTEEGVSLCSSVLGWIFIFIYKLGYLERSN